MTGRLFLHIGPPKTASTSLQVALEALEHPRYSYLGALQPRERNAETVAAILHGATLGQEGLSAHAADIIGKSVISHDLVVLSEEMLSLTQQNTETCEKIVILGKILSGIDVTPIVTLRDPRSALPSLYQELYEKLPLKQQLDFSKFCAGNYVTCYDYAILQKQLETAGFRDPVWVDFDRLTQAGLSTRELFGEQDLWGGRQLTLPRLNSGSHATTGERQLPSINAGALRKSRILRRLVDFFGLSGGRLIRPLRKLVRLVPIGIFRNPSLIIPNEVATRLSAGYIARLRRSQASTRTQ